MMRRILFVLGLLALSSSGCFAQDQAELCPKHIESPTYPPIGRSAALSGKIDLELTIAVDGTVSDVKVVGENGRGVKGLEKTALDNARLWTFSKPPTAPYTQTMTYDFELDGSLPGYGGARDLPAITKVTFDLPHIVNIRTNLMIVETSKTKK